MILRCIFFRTAQNIRFVSVLRKISWEIFCSQTTRICTTARKITTHNIIYIYIYIMSSGFEKNIQFFAWYCMLCKAKQKGTDKPFRSICIGFFRSDKILILLAVAQVQRNKNVGVAVTLEGTTYSEPWHTDKKTTDDICRPLFFGRSDKIRTCDLLVPNQAL